MSANSSIISFKPSRSAAAYVSAFFVTLLVLAGLSCVVRITYLRSIAPRVTGNVAFDQKLLFIKQGKFRGIPIALVAGSSMALNNLDTDGLEKSEGIRYLNVGSWGQSMAQTAEFVSLLESQLDVKQLTVVTQFFELEDRMKTQSLISDDDLRRYFSDSIWSFLRTPLDVLDALTAKYKWSTTYGNSHAYTYVEFTRTGSVPLDIGKRDIHPERWYPKQEFLASCEHCMAALTAMCASAVKRKIPFLVVLPPLTQYIRSVRPDVRELYDDRRRRLAEAVGDCGGNLFDAELYADFDDSCFADFAHLNAEGDRRMTRLFLQWKQGALSPAAKRGLNLCSAIHAGR